MESKVAESKFKNNPAVDMRKPTGFVECVLKKEGRKVVTNKEKGWEKFIWEISLLDTDFGISEKKGNDYIEASVEEGAVVDLWATPGLHKKLEMFGTEARVRIEKIDLKGKKGSPYEVRLAKVKR
jgi:hypothetical protein